MAANGGKLRYRVLIERQNLLVSDYCDFGTCGVFIDGTEIEMSDSAAPVLMEDSE